MNKYLAFAVIVLVFASGLNGQSVGGTGLGNPFYPNPYQSLYGGPYANLYGNPGANPYANPGAGYVNPYASLYKPRFASPQQPANGFENIATALVNTLPVELQAEASQLVSAGKAEYTKCEELLQSPQRYLYKQCTAVLLKNLLNQVTTLVNEAALNESSNVKQTQ
uniref:Putative conserved secreted protein n=1 Tax=Corethrella appendiculata TaxID=1370023 RepID=U5ENX8_9DIPT